MYIHLYSIYHVGLYHVIKSLVSLNFICLILLPARCMNLTNPANGTLACSIRVAGVPSTGDTCTVTCNRGLVPRDGDVTRTCMSNGNWSGTEPVCKSGSTTVL